MVVLLLFFAIASHCPTGDATTRIIRVESLETVEIPIKYPISTTPLGENVMKVVVIKNPSVVVPPQAVSTSEVVSEAPTTVPTSIISSSLPSLNISLQVPDTTTAIPTETEIHPQPASTELPGLVSDHPTSTPAVDLSVSPVTYSQAPEVPSVRINVPDSVPLETSIIVPSPSRRHRSTVSWQ